MSRAGLFARILTTALVSLIGASAFALNFTIEPYGGYEFGYQVQGTTAYGESGPDLGIRAGVDFGGPILGVDYMTGNLSIPKPGNNYSSKTVDIGAYVGYDWQTVKFWGAYWFQSTGSNTGSDYTGDGGYSVGFAVKVWSMVSFVVEKNYRSYQKQGSTTLNPDLKEDGMMLGFSIPFSF